MRTITLLRHAKSSWETPEGTRPLADKQRPLSPRGLRDAPCMAAWMVANSIAPDLVLCSTAERTRQTYEIVVPQLKPRPAKTLHLDSLYLADASSLLQAARALPAKVRHVLFIGHDPGMHDLAALLIGAGDPAVRAALRPKFPTAGLVVIDFDVGTWDEVGPGLGTLRHFMAPKRLPD